MKRQKYLSLILFFILPFVFSSCEDDDKDNEETETIPTELKKISEDEFILYNQYSDEKFLYDVQKQTVTTDTTADFDFSFAYCDVYSPRKYIIAAPCSKELQVEWFRVKKEYRSRQKTIFYNLPDNFSQFKFDTLKTVAGLNEVLDQSTKIYNGDNTTDCIISDQYGWAEGQLFGFKLSSGKNGILQIIKLSKYEEGKPGNICLHVKYESD